MTASRLQPADQSQGMDATVGRRAAFPGRPTGNNSAGGGRSFPLTSIDCSTRWTLPRAISAFWGRYTLPRAIGAVCKRPVCCGCGSGSLTPTHATSGSMTGASGAGLLLLPRIRRAPVPRYGAAVTATARMRTPGCRILSPAPCHWQWSPALSSSTSCQQWLPELEVPAGDQNVVLHWSGSILQEFDDPATGSRAVRYGWRRGRSGSGYRWSPRRPRAVGDGRLNKWFR